MLKLHAERVAEVFVEFADILVDEFDLIEFLQMVAVRASQLVGSGHTGVLLADARGQLQFIAASDERTELLELFQVQAKEGPCQDCFHLGAPVVANDLREAGDRWPVFVPRAVQAGFRSVHAFPMKVRNASVGALNIFGTSVGSMTAEDTRIIQALADIATVALHQESTVGRGQVLTAQLQAALNSRIAIEQAKGAIAQTHNCSVDEAFDLLRSHCQSNGLALTAVAQSILDDPTTIPPFIATSTATLASRGVRNPIARARVLGACRVLICDDQPDMRRALSEVVNALPDFEMVGEAADGFQLVEMLTSAAADVVIVDYKMPGGGPQLVQDIRATNPTIKILVFTGHRDQTIHKAMLAAGADELIVKTGRIGPLREALQRAAAVRESS